MGEIGYIFNLIFTFPIFNGLTLLYYLFNDFGLAIIVLTIVIKLILFPLTLQQLKSMKATQALQPKMAEIRKKYGKDQQGQAVAMQALYKEAGVNPLAGCLPLLIQMPVLYGMFNAFNSVLRTNTGETAAQHLVRINGFLYPFVPHFSQFPNIFLNWFTFLGPSYHFSLGDPDPTKILPILAALATFIQLRMSMARTAASAPANDPTTQQMKMMQYIMPLFTLYLGWTFPAGLALYWFVSTVFQGVQQYFVTGWGALSSTPKLSELLGFGNNKSKANGTVDSKAYHGDSKRERALLARAEADAPEIAASDDEDSEEEHSPIASKLHTPTRGGGNGSSGSSAYNRRKGGRSASARRRSTQRSRG